MTPSMTLGPEILRKRLIDHASERYRAAGQFAYHFARGKLGKDPVFFCLLELGLFPGNARILDLGCGQGLLAAWLLSARQLYDAGDWPGAWPARFEEGDMRLVDFGQADVVVITDAVHYVDAASQHDILRRARAALPPSGLLLTRVGDAGAGPGFQVSRWIDRAVALFRGNGLPRLHCRRLPDWIGALEALGFRVETAPMNGALRFANVMLIARLGQQVGAGL
jgi:SAM-dependent methyltransferase